jgi:DNA-binding XRE family transcriptional regulator
VQICTDLTSIISHFSHVRKKNYLRREKELIALGKHLRSIRMKKKLTMKELADMTDIDHSQISRIERGLISTSVSQLFAIAESLEINIKDLFDFDV